MDKFIHQGAAAAQLEVLEAAPWKLEKFHREKVSFPINFLEQYNIKCTFIELI